MSITNEFRSDRRLALSSAGHERLLLWFYAATICLSAFLLFAVQPLFARLVLPKLGGSPSVWAVSMCFFQAMLLLGYFYAHLLNTMLAPARAILLHMLVLATACLALPVALPAMASEPAGGNTYVWLIGILGAGVGVPFFAVSASAPLLQSWFGRTGHAQATDPYFLYGASNLGSLAALLLYPVIAEPLFGLAMQSRLWTWGFLALVLSILGCGTLLLTRLPVQSAMPVAVDRSVTISAVSSRQRLRWIILSFVPSGLLVAFTTHLTTDIAAAPFLWVLPLALFLATFIVVFRDPPLVPVRLLAAVLPFVIGIVYMAMITVDLLAFWVSGVAGLAAFLMISLVCHRTLYEQRPATGQLTEFYLWMSLGGVLGGVFSAMVAPALFTSIFEFPLLVLAGLLAQPRLLWRGYWRRQGRGGALIALVGLAILVLAELVLPNFPGIAGRSFGLCVAAIAFGGVILVRRSPVWQAGFLMVMLIATVLPSESIGIKHAVRSFFGLHRVGETASGDMRILLHGTTVHGAQRLKTAAGQPIERPVPMTYYHPEGPMARSLALLDGARRVGIVGLGTGALACYARPADSWRLFEIDPAVVGIARDSGLFSYLSTCLPKVPVIVGDARLTLTAEPAASFDYLLVDAFSSDAIPVHLMTTEALKLYLTKLTDKGLLAIHVSNLHLDLAPVLAASLTELPGVSGVLVRERRPGGGLDATGSRVVLLSRDAQLIARALAWADAKPLRSTGVAAWTDDYADLFSALRRGVQ
jgi:hypothetical protein